MRFKDNIVSLGGAALLMSSTCAAPVALIVKLCLDHTEETTPAYKGVLLCFIICASSNSTFFIHAWRPSRVSDPR